MIVEDETSENLHLMKEFLTIHDVGETWGSMWD
jgi:hypothetical protein